VYKGKVVSQVHGSFCDHLMIDDKVYFDWRYHKAHRVRFKDSKLPSDWRYRMDIAELSNSKNFQTKIILSENIDKG